MSLKRNILKNGVATMLSKLVRVLEQLLLVPFFITAWGAAYYGEWLTLTIIPSVLAFSNLGFGSAAANSFTLRYAAGDKQTAANIERTGLTIISGAVCLGIVVSVVVLLVGVYLNWFDKSLIATGDAVKALTLMIASRLVGFYSQLFEAHFIAARRAALGINLGTVGSALNLAVGATVLFSGGGIVAFALSQCFTSVLFNLFFWWIAIRTLGLQREYKGVYDKTQAKEIVKKGFGYLTFPAWQAVFFQGTTFIVRITLGPVAVAVFNTVRTLSRSLNQLFSVINGSIFPELQFEIGAKHTEQAQKLFVNAIRLTILLALAGVAFLAVFGLPVYNLWTHKALTPPTAMWYLFLAGVLLNAVWWATENVYRAMNKPYQLGVAALIVAIVSVGISYFSCQLWGLTGAATGSLIFELIMLVYVLPVSCRLMQMPVKHIFNKKYHNVMNTIQYNTIQYNTIRLPFTNTIFRAGRCCILLKGLCRAIFSGGGTKKQDK